MESLTQTKLMAVMQSPVMLIEAVDSHGRVLVRHRLQGAGAICKIGRSLMCDIVIDDAYAAAEHTSILLLDDGRVTISDLGNINGTRLSSAQGSQRLTRTSVTVEEAQLIVGRTRLRLRTLHSTLEPERLFRRDLLQRHRTLLAGAGLIAVFLLAVVNEWLQAPEQLSTKVLTSILATTVVIAAWIGLWALITRVGHGVWNLRLHMAIACTTAALAIIATWLLAFAAFAIQWNWLDSMAVWVVALALPAALYLHLRSATHLSVRSTAIIAVLLPLLVGGAITWIDEQSNARDVNRIDIGTAIFPPQVLLARGNGLDNYFNNVAALKTQANRNREASLEETPLADPQDGP